VTILERHSYKKIHDNWEITKTVKLYYERVPYTLSSLSVCSKKLEDCLTPDLVTKKYREENQNNPMYGHCYHTTQAMFYLLDTDTLDIMSGIDWRGDKHWWLRDRITGYEVDMTVDQYYSIDKQPPYDDGKISKWYGWKHRPHMRTLKLIMRMQPDIATLQTDYFEK
tara:strand:- start:370 stop:870 length:501 start_codon:yes stop_codon:yes gene_type:complete